MIYSFGSCEIDVDRRELRKSGTAVHVEPQVFDLLVHLVRHPGRVLTKDTLIQAVWNGRVISDATLTSRISAARRAIDDAAAPHGFIRTISRCGYRFDGVVRERAGHFDRPTGSPGAIQSGDPRAEPPQEITFCRTADGVHLAVATAGSGPALVKTANWLNHLEYDWQSPLWAHETGERSLKLIVAQRFRLTDQQGRIGIELVATLHGFYDCLGHVFQVNKRLPPRDVAGKEFARQLALEDALDLVRERDRVAFVVVDAGDAQADGTNVSALSADQRFGRDFRARVVPFRLERRMLVDALPGLRGRVGEHGAGEDELFDLELVQRAEKAASPANGDLIVHGARFSREVVVGRQVHDGVDLAPISVTDALDGGYDTLIRGEVNTNALGFPWGMWPALPVEADHWKLRAKDLTTGRPMRPLLPVTRTTAILSPPY
jgi:DNA-binding winged helix-turn-helix (wHTH) protein